MCISAYLFVSDFCLNSRYLTANPLEIEPNTERDKTLQVFTLKAFSLGELGEARKTLEKLEKRG